MQVVVQEANGRLCNFLKLANQKRGSMTIFNLAQEKNILNTARKSQKLSQTPFMGLILPMFSCSDLKHLV